MIPAVRLQTPLSILAGLALCLGCATAALAAGPPPDRVAAFNASRSAAIGERTVVRGAVSPPGPATVVIERRLADYTWAPLATLRANAKGRFRAKLPLRRSARLRASLQLADGTLVPGEARRSVTIARRAVLKLTVDETEAIAGRPIRVNGRVWPARPGERAPIEAVRRGKVVRMGSLRVRTGGRVRGAVRLPRGGRWVIRLAAPGMAGVDRTGRSRPMRLRVYTRNPHNVPRNASHYIVQDIGETLLYYYEGGSLRRVLPVVYGKPSTPTPIGRFRVYSKTTGPSAPFGPLVLWYHRGYGIHGTNQEYLLDLPPRYYSHGCTRNYNDNIRWLWPRVPVGTPVLNIA
jgi:lipoprotein-anchoring transpeptidase ErfK/SrfK